MSKYINEGEINIGVAGRESQVDSLGKGKGSASQGDKKKNELWAAVRAKARELRAKKAAETNQDEAK